MTTFANPTGGPIGESARSARICVITPFYNTAAYLDQCIRSVRAQTFTDFEYILCDNASDDDSSEIARMHAAQDDRIRYRRLEEHVGQVENYNRALQLLNPDAEYCKIVQADDWLLPECIARMVALADASPTVGIVGYAWFRGP